MTYPEILNGLTEIGNHFKSDSVKTIIKEAKRAIILGCHDTCTDCIYEELGVEQYPCNSCRRIVKAEDMYREKGLDDEL